MLKLLLVSPEKEALSGLASALEKYPDVDLSWAESGNAALNIISDRPVDLLVTDENLGDMTGLELTGRLLAVNPMVNCAAVSSLSSQDFHEASEGLGLLMQLPIQAGEEHAEDLLRHLRQIKELTDRAQPFQA